MKKRNQNGSFTHYLAVWGSLCTGLVYTGIGIIAVLSFLNIKRGGADETSMLVYLHTFLVGRIFVWLILSGMVGYITWRIYETVIDPYCYGNGVKGILRRAAIAMSSLADALIAYSAVRVLLGISGAEETGQPTAERDMARDILNQDSGVSILTGGGILLLLVAITQMGYVINNTYSERLDIQHLKRWKRKTIHIFAWVGHFARGLILGIIGFFLAKAGVTQNEQYVVNTDKAFDFIGDHLGAVNFLLAAAGTICYGIFMFLQGAYYNSYKH